MFEFFRKHTWLLKVILAFVVVAFVGGGVYQGYGSFMNDENTTVAKVDGRKITRTEWDAAQREQMDRVRARAPNVDPKLFDTPEMRAQALEAIVHERVMLAAADHQHLVVGDERLQRLFATDPQLANLRNADGSVNKEVLASQGLSSEGFAQRLRQDLSLRQVTQGISGTVFGTSAATTAALNAMFQQREVQVQRFNSKDLADKIAPTDAEIEAYYKDPVNAQRFFAPENETIQYVVLDLETLKKGVEVSDKDLRDYYAANEARYTVAEERRASHILVKVDPGASGADKAKAKAKAEGLLAEIRKSPGSFAEVARKNSDDPGSATNGGDLDFFARGGLAAKPLEDAAFGMKPDEVAGPVESEFGYHLIKLTGVRGGDKRSFESMRAEMEGDVRAQLAQKRYSEAAVEFTNMVYEQPDSLKPVADRFKLELRSAEHLLRTPTPGASGPLASAKFLDSVFGNDAVANKRNTEAIETAPNTLVSGRVVMHEAAHRLPLAEVRAKVRERIVAVQSAALARKLGEARLAALKAAPDAAMPDAPLIVSRATRRDLPGELLDAMLKAPAAKLPAFVGVDLGDTGYVVAKIGKVLERDPITADPTRGQEQYGQVWGDAEATAYYAALKTRFKVELKPVARSADAASGAGVAPAK